MTNATDFISTVYDTLAKLLNLDNTSQSLFLQMAWPGYSLSPEDFKPASAPNGPYDSEIAKEVFSNIANIVPVFSKARFENSGFEIDDIYEILIASAIPVGATQESIATNPINRLFSDAQYEFMQARRGSKTDPNVFYYPCTATPSNWYDEAASQFWPTITIQSTDIKPVNAPTSSFIKAGGQILVNQGIWKLKPDTVNETVLKAHLQETVNTKDAMQKKRLQVATATPVLEAKVPTTLTPITAKSVVNTKPINANIITATQATVGTTHKLTDTNFTRTPEFRNNLSNARNTAIFSTKSTPVNTFSNTTFKANLQTIAVNQQLELKNTRNLNVAQKFLVTDIIYEQLSRRPASTATDGFSISFKMCRVNVDRDWFKLALLSTRNWYMFNTNTKEYSTGDADNNPGMFPLLPVSFIVICDLKITANWSQEDKSNLDKAVSFGPFDIRNRTLNQNTLEVKGLQIIAWISKLMPPLPPTQA